MGGIHNKDKNNKKQKVNGRRYIYIFQLSGFSNLHRPYTFLLMTDWRELGHHHPARHTQGKLVPPTYTPSCIVLKGNSRYILCPIDVRPLYKVGGGVASPHPPPHLTPRVPHGYPQKIPCARVFRGHISKYPQAFTAILSQYIALCNGLLMDILARHYGVLYSHTSNGSDSSEMIHNGLFLEPTLKRQHTARHRQEIYINLST